MRALMTKLAFAAWVSLVLSGCMSSRVLPISTRTPAACGNIKLYGTDNVPFEYEELGVVSVTCYDVADEQMLKTFAAEAATLGADAVLNFSLEQQIGVHVFFGFGMHDAGDVVCLKGTAVKIRKP